MSACQRVRCAIACTVLAAVLPAPIVMSSPLPRQADVDAAVESAPEIATARAQLEVAQATAHFEAASPLPWVAHSAVHERSVTGEPINSGTGPRDYGEWDVSVEHGLRLPGKRRLDASVAEMEVTRAEAGLADMRRSVRNNVLETWYDCVAAIARTRRADEERRAAGALTQIIERRLAAGDAAPMEATLVAAESAVLAADAAGAAVALSIAQNRLAVRGLPASCDNATLEDAAPTPMTLSPTATVDPAIRLANAAADLALVRAERARAERHPDPSIGVRYASERGGMEKIVGIFVTVPLPNSRASAEADRAGALARVADAEQRQTERQATQRIDALFARVRMARAQWAAQNEAAKLQSQASQQALRAYTLGESGLAATLIAQRTARVARTSAEDSLLEVWRSESLVRVQTEANSP